ncbi:MAG: hypothetical protein ACRDHL_05740 [Candidatus Promineifilaceae bacterium]
MTSRAAGRALSLALSVIALAALAPLAAAGPDPDGARPPDGSQTPLVSGQATGREVGQACNLLENPSFEGQYGPYIPPDGHPDCPGGICQTAQMAPGWTPWWVSHDPDDPPWMVNMPEYKPATTKFTDPARVRSGERAQQYFTFFKTHIAGFYQQVAVTPGEEYEFRVWSHSWSADDDDDAYSGPEFGQLEEKIGLDPFGGDDWSDPDVVWGPMRQQYDEYGLFAVSATAQAPTMTVFVYSAPFYAVKHNDVYWDDAELGIGNPVFSVTPADDLRYLVRQSEPQVITQTLDISLPADCPINWTAQVLPGASLALNLSATSGGAGDDLTISFDTAGLAGGAYSADLLLWSDPPLDEGENIQTISLVILTHDEYLPFTWAEDIAPAGSSSQ